MSLPYLKDSFQFIAQPPKIFLNEKLKYQEKFFDPTIHNTNQEEIYKQLETLYNKVHVFEDITNHVESELVQRVQTYSKQCRMYLKEIEKDRDAIKSSTYNTVVVPLVNTEKCNDRNNTLLPMADHFNQSIVQKYYEKEDFDYTALIEHSAPFYKDNYEEFKNGKAYRAYYVVDQPFEKGITQTIKCSFLLTEPINMVSITPSRSQINLLNITKGKTITKIEKQQWLKPIEADQFSIFLHSDVFETKTFLCDESRLTPSAYEQLNALVYNSFDNDITISKSKIEDVLGIERYRQSYFDYVERVKIWLAKREVVSKTNKENGYTDHFELPKIVVPPKELGVDMSFINSLKAPVIVTDNILSKKEVVNSNGERFVQPHIESIVNTYPSAELNRLDLIRKENL